MFSPFRKIKLCFLGGLVFWRARICRGDRFILISRPLFLVLALGLLLSGTPLPTMGAEMQVRLLGGGVIKKKVESIKERRLRQVVPQTLDFSCGAAALASLIMLGR